MKTNYFLVALFALAMVSMNAQIDPFEDDMESYTDGEPIYGGHWKDWGCGGGPGCAIMSSSDESHSGSLSGLIPDDSTTDAALDLGTKSFGIWHLEFWMFIPTNKEAFWIIKGEFPTNMGADVGMFYFNQNNENPGIGLINDIALGEVNFEFPHDEWFRIQMIVDISSGITLSTWELYINYVEVIPCETPFTNGAGVFPASLGAINFFSASGSNRCYLDDFYYNNSESTCFLGVEENIEIKIKIYPNPTNNILSIDNTSNTVITSIKFYDVIGRLVLEENNSFNQIDVSNLTSGLLFVEIETEQGKATKKVIKE